MTAECKGDTICCAKQYRQITTKKNTKKKGYIHAFR